MIWMAEIKEEKAQGEQKPEIAEGPKAEKKEEPKAAKKEEPKAEKKEEPKAAKKEEPAKRDEKPAKGEKKGQKEEPKEEKVLTVSLKGALKAPRSKRAKIAVRILKQQLTRHIKRDVLVSTELNSKVWAHGIERPPRKVKARVEITKDKAIAYPME